MCWSYGYTIHISILILEFAFVVRLSWINTTNNTKNLTTGSPQRHIKMTLPKIVGKVDSSRFFEIFCHSHQKWIELIIFEWLRNAVNAIHYTFVILRHFGIFYHFVFCSYRHTRIGYEIVLLQECRYHNVNIFFHYKLNRKMMKKIKLISIINILYSH